MEKIKIEKNTVQETLIIPLYGRKMCSEKFSALYTDIYAKKLCDRLDYDFSELEKKNIVRSRYCIDARSSVVCKRIWIFHTISNFANSLVRGMGNSGKRHVDKKTDFQDICEKG